MRPDVDELMSAPPVPGFDDVTDADLRARADLNWAAAPPDVLPSWVAEMDYAPCPAVEAAVVETARLGRWGYPALDALARVRSATADFAARQWGWAVEPELIVATGDVMAGVILTLGTLCEAGPVVVPTPAYPPFLMAVPVAGRPLVTVPLDPDLDRATLDLDGIDTALTAGARTVLLCNPHNPWGRSWTADELTGLRDVVLRHGARVVSDEIHAPLVRSDGRHTPYAALDGTADHVTTVLSASKAFNVAGLKCAQLVAGGAADADRLRDVPRVANHGASPLGIEATVTAYREGDEWLTQLRAHLDRNRDLVEALVAQRLPRARMRPTGATYLAWLDLRAYGHQDPAAVALERGRVMVADGRTFGPGGEGHVRVNLATSRTRLVDLVQRLARAFEDA